MELPKFLKSKENGNRKLRQWLEFICNKRKGEIEMAVKENEKIAKASQEWEYLRGDEAVKRMAFLREKWERDWNSGMHSAEEAGIEKGMKKGVKKEKEEITIKMLEEGIDEKIILKVTSLTLEEIEKIKEKLKSEVEYEVK
ncbi:MAG: PD-(D/E)XK nuclease family transposase [Clostridium sp.]|nr:PD-(D/E)XK nuclease family transposase [Clostridium sp.]